jgi:hypothetical protein
MRQSLLKGAKRGESNINNINRSQEKRANEAEILKTKDTSMLKIRQK